MESLGDIYKNIKIQKEKNPDKLREMVQVSSLSDCKLCAGTGWLAQDVEIFEADFGKIFPCKCLMNAQLLHEIVVILYCMGL